MGLGDRGRRGRFLWLSKEVVFSSDAESNSTKTEESEFGCQKRSYFARSLR